LDLSLLNFGIVWGRPVNVVARASFAPRSYHFVIAVWIAERAEFNA